MKKLNQALTIEDVEKLHMETREAIKYQEVSQKQKSERESHKLQD